QGRINHGQRPFITEESNINLAAVAKLTTASTYKKGILKGGAVIVGVCYGSVKNYSRILEESERLRRSFPPAEKKGCKARHNAAQNDHSFPDEARGKHEMRSCTKRRQQPHQRRFSHSNPTLGQRQKRRQFGQRPCKKPVPQRKEQPAGDGQKRSQCEKRGLYPCRQNPSEKYSVRPPGDAS